MHEEATRDAPHVPLCPSSGRVYLDNGKRAEIGTKAAKEAELKAAERWRFAKLLDGRITRKMIKQVGLYIL